MARVNRRKRTKLAPEETLEGIWNRGDAPPDWAYDPGEHHQELVDLYFFGTDEDWENGRKTREHPHYEEWFEAMKASNQG